MDSYLVSLKINRQKTVEANILEERKVKALEKIGKTLDALVMWFEEIDKEEWNERIQFQSLDTVHTRISTFVTIKSLSNKSRLFMYAEETHKQNVANNYIKLKSLIE